MNSLILWLEKSILTLVLFLTVAAVLKECQLLWEAQTITLSDLFLFFIYAEVIGMVGAFYVDSKIPVTLPIIIAITALTRMVVLSTKGEDTVNILYESLGILILSVSAMVMSYKGKLSLEKDSLRKK
jgi:protein PsiE